MRQIKKVLQLSIKELKLYCRFSIINLIESLQRINIPSKKKLPDPGISTKLLHLI